MANTLPPDYEGLDNKTVFERALSDYYSVHIAVAYTPEVVLPESLKTADWKARKSVIHLEYGLDMPIPISDLVVNNEGVAATLSFSREPFKTYVPWHAVVGFHCDGLKPPPPKARPKLGLVK